jgi:hypothetical protein
MPSGTTNSMDCVKPYIVLGSLPVHEAGSHDTPRLGSGSSKLFGRLRSLRFPKKPKRNDFWRF